MKEKKLKPKNEKYLISGKIKAEKTVDSLEGFKVLAYLKGTKIQLGSAVTDAEGNYKIKYEFDKPVDVNLSVCPDVDEKVLKVIPKAKHFISKKEWQKDKLYFKSADITISTRVLELWEVICKKYLIHGMVVQGIPDTDNPGSYLDYIPIPNATVHIYDISYPWPPWDIRPLTKHEIGTATTDENGLFALEFDWCYLAWWLIFPPPDIKPDILFKVTQTVNDIEVPIYEEDPESETRWELDNLPPLGVTLIVGDDVDVVLPDDLLPPIEGDFEFHGIGRVLISQINSDGYADTSGSGDVVGAKDSPFGSTIDIKGQFHDDLHGKFYQILYARWMDDTTPPEESDFTPILDEVWPIAQKVGLNWVTIYKSPVELPGVGDGCYEIPDYSDLYLTSKDILIRWTTYRKDFGAPRYLNGKYSLKVKFFNADGSGVTTPDLEFIVRVDNTQPVALIKEDIDIIGGTLPICPDPKPPGLICDNPEVCGIIYIESGKQLRIKFDAYDEHNHFRNYYLTYRTGHASEVAIPGGSKYFNDSEPQEDFGFTNETIDWNIGSLNQCGYEIRLRVWDRTINGYHHIHRSEDFIHIILLEKPT